MAKTKCPYCADAEFLDRVLTPDESDHVVTYNASMRRYGSHWLNGKKFKKPLPLKKGAKLLAVGYAVDPRFVVHLGTPEIKRGKYLVKTVTDAHLTPRYAGFQVQIVGVESRTELPSPSGAFLSRKWTEGENGKPENFVYYFAARITHKDSTLKIDVHSHEDHGRMVTVHGFASHQNTPKELEIIGKAFEFYRQETRGGAKIDEAKLRRTIRERGERATQKEIAEVFGVTVSAIRDQLRRRGTSWDVLKDDVLANAEAG
jgi:hypothetical protein